jgi:hypothetical protein
MQPDEGAVPVFLFYEDGSGVEAFESLDAAASWVEAIDVKAGEYRFLAVDGRAVEADVGGRFDQDVVLRVTDEDMSALLHKRLADALPGAGMDAGLAASPRLAAQALADAQWEARWPRWPAWLARRLHRERPVLFSD